MSKIADNLPAPEKQKKYPVRCIECGEREVRPAIISRGVTKNHDGRSYELHVGDLPVTQCASCGAVSFTSESEVRIALALRQQLGLLTPEQIESNLRTLGLSQKETAERLGVAAETLSRWLTGAMIQSRAMDNFMRSFFACPQVREKLTGGTMDRMFGALVGQPETRAGNVVLRLAFRTQAQRQHLRAIFGRPDVSDFARVLSVILEHPKTTQSFSLFSRVIVQAIYGSDPLSDQCTLFGERADSARIDRWETVFESLTRDFASIPESVRPWTLEAFSEAVKVQKTTIAQLRPGLATAMGEI